MRAQYNNMYALRGIIIKILTISANKMCDIQEQALIVSYVWLKHLKCCVKPKTHAVFSIVVIIRSLYKQSLCFLWTQYPLSSLGRLLMVTAFLYEEGEKFHLQCYLTLLLLKLNHYQAI